MSGRSWWLLTLSLIGIALVALLAVIAYALLSDEDGKSAEQAAQPTVIAAPTLPPPTPTPPPPTFEPSIENPFDPCAVEEVVLSGLGAACVWEFDPKGCYTLSWADYVIEESCPHRRSEPWPAYRCEEAIQRLGFMEELCREQGETEAVSSECNMVKVMGDLFADRCSR